MTRLLMRTVAWPAFVGVWCAVAVTGTALGIALRLIGGKPR